jgi:sec-independent protein translocase protein TatB
MFDMGWFELAIVGLVVVLVLGPDELPHAMKSFARLVRKGRRLASEFQGHLDDLVSDADLGEVKRTVSAIRRGDVGSAIKNLADPDNEIASEVKSTVALANDEIKDISMAPKTIGKKESVSSKTRDSLATKVDSKS